MNVRLSLAVSVLLSAKVFKILLACRKQYKIMGNITGKVIENVSVERDEEELRQKNCCMVTVTEKEIEKRR